MTNNETNLAILKCISNFTNIIPEVYFREDSSNIMVCFQKDIPDEESTNKIGNALKEFGQPIPNHYREASFISFIIHR